MAAVGVLGIPFWLADLVLAGRFDVGVGGGGDKLGGPLSVLGYLGRAAGDFTAGPWSLPCRPGARGGRGVAARHGSAGAAALLVAAVVGTPTAAFLVARLGSSTSPETRHLIFVLPFFATLVAAGLVALARRPARFAAPARSRSRSCSSAARSPGPGSGRRRSSGATRASAPSRATRPRAGSRRRAGRTTCCSATSRSTSTPGGATRPSRGSSSPAPTRPSPRARSAALRSRSGAASGCSTPTTPTT